MNIVEILASAPVFPNVINQYKSTTVNSDIKKVNLLNYFLEMIEKKPKYLLVGESPGYSGCLSTGIPFTSESILAKYNKKLDLFGIENGYRIENTANPKKESTSTIVWDVLAKNNFIPLLWNSFPFYPFEKDKESIRRNPNKDELKFGISVLNNLLHQFEIKYIIAIGEISFISLKENNIQSIKIAHPEYDGKAAFSSDLAKIVKRNGT